MNFRDKLSRFMYNRYGVDKLSYALVAIYVVLVLLNLWIKSNVVYYLSVLIILLVIFRMTSKNKSKRQVENRLFEKYFNPLITLLKLEKRRILEIKTHRFRKCPKCKLVLRLKRKTGTHQVDCPRCHQEVTVRIWF